MKGDNLPFLEFIDERHVMDYVRVIVCVMRRFPRRMRSAGWCSTLELSLHPDLLAKEDAFSAKAKAVLCFWLVQLRQAARRATIVH